MTQKAIICQGLKGGIGKTTFSLLLAKELSKTHTVAYIDLDVSSSSFSQFSGQIFEENSMQVVENKIQPFMWKHKNDANAIEVISTSMLVGSKKSVVGEQMTQFIDDILNHSQITSEYIILDAPAGLGNIYRTATKNLFNRNIHLGDIILSIPAQKNALEKILEYTTRHSKVLGVVTNFSEFGCPNCGNNYNIFGKEIAQDLCRKYNIEYIGSVPISLDFNEKTNGGILPKETPYDFLPVIQKTISTILNSQPHKKKKISTSKVRNLIQQNVAKVLVDLFVASNQQLDIPELYKDFPLENSVKMHILDENFKKINTMHLELNSTAIEIKNNKAKSTFELFLSFRTLARIIVGRWKSDDGIEYDYSALDAWRNRDIELIGEGSTTKMVNFFNKLLSDDVLFSVLRQKAGILKGWI